MKKLGRTTLVLLLGFGVTSSMFPWDAYALRKCQLNDGQSSIVYGTGDKYGTRTNEDLNGGLPVGEPTLGGVPSGDTKKWETKKVEEDFEKLCPGPPVRDLDQKKSHR